MHGCVREGGYADGIIFGNGQRASRMAEFAQGSVLVIYMNAFGVAKGQMDCRCEDCDDITCILHLLNGF